MEVGLAIDRTQSTKKATDGYPTGLIIMKQTADNLVNRASFL